MKKWLWIPAVLAAAWLLPRLPHPAVDVADLEPVALVRLEYENGQYRMTTDTGAEAVGSTIEAAADAMKRKASGVILLDTAEVVLLEPDVPVTAELCRVLRPACKVCYASGELDLPAAAAYLQVHPPVLTLAHLAAGERDLEWLKMEVETGGTG